MKDNVLLRFWFITYYISGILIPFAIVFGFVFNRFNVFNCILSSLACLLQFTMFLGLHLRHHHALFMYSTMCLTLVHIGLLVYLIYMTQTLSKHIRSDLERDIETNQTEFRYRLQIRFYRCCRLDRTASDRTAGYFREHFPQFCSGAEQRTLKPCWPSLQSMTLVTKIIYWSIWLFQTLLLVLAWIYYGRLGRLTDQVPLSLRKTLQQVHSEILLENRLYKRWIKAKQPSHMNTITNLKNSRLSASNSA